MLRSRSALVAGVIFVLLVFAYGTETRVQGTIDGHRLDCGPPISTTWLVSGTPDVYDGLLSGADDRRRAAAVCEPIVESRRRGVIGIMAAGALLALVGWTAMRERGDRRRAGRPVVGSA